uniref:Cytochrome b-245 light chain n=1 Tax=Ciona intestinalis TaxID=7719 RepID=H2XNI4_CIOIN|nr:cytochrome b-245 light chain isoform X1 [Ciona intestinalis]|eukprot:XP_002119312.1 cytochrome b-245 light chain isoform X1 [Ciona intestinalis]
MPSSSSNIRSIQWGMWANETALLGSYVLTLGGIIGIVGGLLKNFMFWLPIGIYGVVFGILVGLLEYPRGKKNKGNTLLRSGQSCFSTMVNKLPFVSSYYFRAIAYFIVCIPGIISVPTFLGSVCVIVGSGIYLGAALHKERWNPIESRPQVPSTSNDITQPPSQPPPRLPQNKQI